MKEQLLEAKRKLYSLLLELGDEITDKEVDIMFALSNDEQIRSILKQHFDKSKK